MGTKHTLIVTVMKDNTIWKNNPYIRLEASQNSPKQPTDVRLFSKQLYWTNKDFQSHKQNFEQIAPWISLEMKGKIQLSVETAKSLWTRTLEFAHLLDFPDVLLEPKSRDMCFPRTPEVATKFVHQGYLPLAAGDGYRYSLFKIPGTEHCGIYVGKGYGGHFIVDRDTTKRLGQKIGIVLIENLRDMFSRGLLEITRHEDCNTNLDRAEVVRRVLSSAADQECMGCYRYSVANFNCQTAVNGWRDQPPPDTAWGEALLWTSLALIVVLVVLLILFVCLYSTNTKTETKTITKTYPGNAPGTIVRETSEVTNIG
jgi:hypothetical protein